MEASIKNDRIAISIVNTSRDIERAISLLESLKDGFQDGKKDAVKGQSPKSELIERHFLNFFPHVNISDRASWIEKPKSNRTRIGPKKSDPLYQATIPEFLEYLLSWHLPIYPQDLCTILSRANPDRCHEAKQ